MKRPSLVNLYKAEIKKSMLAQIKGGDDVKCTCSASNPVVTTRQSGGPGGDYCACNSNLHNSHSVSDKPDAN
jgi:hypothetical protein